MSKKIKVTAKQNEKHSSKKILFITGILLCLAIIYFATLQFTFTGHSIKSSLTEENLEKFVECLNQKKVVLHAGSATCSEIKQQQELLRLSFNQLSVDVCGAHCPNLQGACLLWEINPRFYTGVQTLQQLSLLTQCPLY